MGKSGGVDGYGAGIHPPVGNGAQMVVTLRWVLIVATSYLVLFSRPPSAVGPAEALFVAAYLTSNLVLAPLLREPGRQRLLEIVIVLVDTTAITVAHLLTGFAWDGSFVLYFLVLFLCALTEQIGLVVSAALIIATFHLYTLSHFVAFEDLVDTGELMRIPFLFAAALLFGYLGQNARRRERWEGEQRARAARLEFLSAVSHDLKNPLYVIQSLADLLLSEDDGKLNASQVDLANRIHATARQVTNLALNLIDAERIEAGRLTLQQRHVGLDAVVREALQLARSASELKGIQLTATIAPNLPPAYVDPVQTERVIANVLTNAVKFTPQGGKVALTLQRACDALVLAVTDSGPGILPDQLPGLFEKYQRGRANGRVEGSGLGMFIVRAIVEAQGGSVGISSTVGRGTSVTVSFPAAPSTAVERLREEVRSRPVSVWAATAKRA
jgi:signal transduction histidine kinase